MSKKNSASNNDSADAAERRPAWTFPVEKFSPSFMTPDVQLRPLHEIESQPVVWEGDARLPRGALTIIAGEHGSGKSLMAVDWAARISRGELWSADCASAGATSPVTDGEPADQAAKRSRDIGQSIVAHAGDMPRNLLRLRLDAARANAPQIAALSLAPPDKGQQFDFDAINRRIYSLTCATGGVPNLRLLVIDNLEAWAGNTQEPPCWALMAFLLTRLSEVALHTGVAIVVLANLPRSGGLAAVRRLDQLLTQAPVVYLAVSDPDRHERKLLLPVKNALAPPAPARACEVVDGRLVWSGAAVGATADEFLSARSRRLEARHERESAARWLLAALAGGPLASRELFQQARDCGISSRTLRRAAQSLGLSPRKTSFDGPWQWSLGQAALPGEAAPSASVAYDNTLRCDPTEAHASGSPAREETPARGQDAWHVGTWNPELGTASEDGQPRDAELAPAAAAHRRNGRYSASRA